MEVLLILLKQHSNYTLTTRYLAARDPESCICIITTTYMHNFSLMLTFINCDVIFWEVRPRRHIVTTQSNTPWKTRSREEVFILFSVRSHPRQKKYWVEGASHQLSAELDLQPLEKHFKNQFLLIPKNKEERIIEWWRCSIKQMNECICHWRWTDGMNGVRSHGLICYSVFLFLLLREPNLPRNAIVTLPNNSALLFVDQF